MKRIISILLALMMAFSVANIAFAEETVENVTEAAEPVEVETLDAEAEYARDVQRDEIIRKGFEAKLAEEDDSSALMATYTVKGTITLPGSVKTKSGDKLFIELLSPATIEDGMVVEEYGLNGAYSTIFEPSSNKNSFSYSITTDTKGDYILAVKYYTGHAGVMGDWLYYTADGPTRNPYLADVIKVSSSTKSGINMTLSASETSVSGTLDLSDVSITKDGNIFVYLSNMDFVGMEHEFYCAVPVTKGAESADFELGLPIGNYYMAVSSSFTKYCYYTSSGATNNWSNKETFYVGEEGKVLDMAPLAKSTATADEGIEITLKFKDAADGDTEYYVETVDEYGEYIDGRWVYLNDGEKTVTVTLEATSENDAEVYLSVKTIYDTRSTGWGAEDRNILYYSADEGNGGFVGSIEYATDISSKSSVTVTEQAYVTIKGDCTIEGDAPVNRYMFVGAEFENGESFCTRVAIDNGTYAIRVPKRLAGDKFELFTAEANYNTTANVTMMGDSYTLKSTSTTNAGDVSLGTFTAVTGNITIPFSASENGAVVTLSYGYEVFNGEDYEYIDVNDAAIFVIEPGNTSVEYSMSVPADIDELNIYAYLTMYEEADVTSDADVWVDMTEAEADINFLQSALLYGTISLPEGMVFDTPVSLEIAASQYSNYNYTYVTIPAGETSVDYSVKLAKGDKINRIVVIVENNTALVSEYYYDGEGFTTEYTNYKEVVTGDIEANGTLAKAAGIGVNVVVPESASFTGTARVYAYAEDVNTGTEYSSATVDVTGSGTVPLWIVVPDDPYAEYTIAVYVYDTKTYEGNLLMGDYYYTTTGWSTDYDAGNKVYMTIEDEGISFTVPTKATAKVNIDFPANAYCDGSLSTFICLTDANGNTISEDSFELTEAADKTVEIEFPDTVKGSVYVKYVMYCYGDSNIMSDKGYYYSTSGPVSNIGDATAISVNILKNSGVTIRPEMKKGMSGKIVVDGDYEYVTPFEGFEIILENVGTGIRAYSNAKVDEDLNYSATYDSYISDGEYYVSYALYSNHVNGTNLLRQDETQLLDSNGNRVKVSVTENTDDIDIEVVAGYALSGKVKLPAGAYLSEQATAQLRIKGDMNEYRTEVEGISEENRTVEYMMGINPEDEGEYVLEVSVWEESESEMGGYSNLVFDQSYYRASDTECSDMMEDCETIEVDGNVTGVDVTLMAGVGLDVKMSMPATVVDDCSVDVYIYSSKGWMLDNEYVYFGEWGSRTKAFSVVVPEKYEGETVYLAYEVDTALDSLCHSEMIYVSEDGSFSYTQDEATAFVLGEDNGVIEFTIAKADEMSCVLESDHPYTSGQVYTYEYTHPEEADYLKVYFSSATSMYYSHSLRFQSGENRDIITYYDYGNVISVPGDSFDLVFDAQAYSYYSNYGFKIVKIEGMSYMAESEHPYTKSDLPIEYEYSDKEADALRVYFSGETYIGEGAEMVIYDGNGEMVYRIQGTTESDYYFIEDNEFSLVIDETGYGTFEDGAFGFAIEKIEPVYMHTVTFKDYDGTILEEVEVEDGMYAWYDDVDSLVRESDDENYIYIFNGWDKERELEEVTQDLVVTAQYDYVRAYKITFQNIDGTVLYEQRLPKNYGIFYDGETPVYPYETEENYSFVGWDKELDMVTEDVVITAVFKKIYLESSHPYPSYADERYEHTEAGATSMKLTFSDTTRTEGSYDTISIYYMADGYENHIGTYSGFQLSGKTIDIPSDTVVIYLESDGSVEYYGFAVTDIEAVFDTEGAQTDTHVKVYEGAQTIVNVSVNKNVGGVVMVAAYNVDGDLIWAKEAVIDPATLLASEIVESGEVPNIVKTMVWRGFDDMTPVLDAEITTIDEIEVVGQTGTGGGSSSAGGVTAG